MEALSGLVLPFHGSALLLLALLALSLYWLNVKPIHHRPHRPASAADDVRRLPPALPATAVLTLILQLGCFRQGTPDWKSLLRRVFTTHGLIVTLRAGAGNPTVVVADATLASRILVENGASFAGRPSALEPMPLITAVSAADYDSIWCALRHNLASGILNPSAIRSYTASRRRVLSSLLRRLTEVGESVDGVVAVRDHFLWAMFFLLADMVFGASTLDGDQVKSLQDAHQLLLSYYNGLAFGFLSKIWGSVLPTSMSILPKLRRSHEQIFLPLVRARREKMEMMRRRQQQQQQHPHDQNPPTSYVDTLIVLELPDPTNEGCRKLDDHEIVTFCAEFLSAGAETTSTALEWIMANITKHQVIQKKLVEEMERVIREHGEIKEENIHKMEYLSAVVMEGLRRHPPAYFLLPHRASSDASIGGYSIPKDSTVHFMVGDMGLDEKNWSDPLEFKPERFLLGGAECHKLGVVVGKEEIKMMPFGAGRRACPGLGLAMLLLKYFVANLVTQYDWKAVEEEGIDLTEKLGLTVVMKNPLKARLYKRIAHM
ncbi:hypothetical protein Taro_033797 [Colocasia esculenta]|uniref:Cytochrome P450 n=1 Tax=Colocasia esculenta TaxID=4460 RepID=A0A843VPN6_COLES|nr:hypothetical protein [Colocasia esculenta]